MNDIKMNKKMGRHGSPMSILFVLALFVISNVKGYAQTADNAMKVETFNVIERLTLATNAVDWVTMTPNLGFEYDVRKENWNRWTVGLNAKLNFSQQPSYNQKFVYQVREYRFNFRNYWRPRFSDERYKDDLGLWQTTGNHPTHIHWIPGKLFSQRRKSGPKHEKTVYYRGLYGSVGDYDFKVSDIAKEGSYFSIGMMYGIIRPLFIYEKGGSLNVDFGFSIGPVIYKEKEYNRDINGYYVPGEEGGYKIMPLLPTDIKVGLVYRFGHRTILDRYMFRYDVDAEYMERYDEMCVARENAARQKRRTQDSLFIQKPLDQVMEVAEQKLAAYPKNSYQYAVLKGEVDRLQEERLTLGTDIDSMTILNRDVMTRELQYYMKRAAFYAGEVDETGESTVVDPKKAKKEAKKTKGQVVEATNDSLVSDSTATGGKVKKVKKAKANTEETDSSNGQAVVTDSLATEVSADAVSEEAGSKKKSKKKSAAATEDGEGTKAETVQETSTESVGGEDSSAEATKEEKKSSKKSKKNASDDEQ